MKWYYILFVPLTVFLASCDPDDPAPINEEELITSLVLELYDNGGNPDRKFIYQDLDGDGGDPPIILTDTLLANTTYMGRVSVLNEAETPPIRITDEVQAEAEEHQFFFEVSGVDMTVSYADQDADGFPLGLSINAETQGAGEGTITITLRHEPDKDASGVRDGIIDNAGGETDIQVTFPVVIQ